MLNYEFLSESFHKFDLKAAIFCIPMTPIKMLLCILFTSLVETQALVITCPGQQIVAFNWPWFVSKIQIGQ